MMSERAKTIRAACYGLIAVVVVFYLGTYYCLSVQGRYEPEAIGVDHIKWYAWSPRGFWRHGEYRNNGLINLFSPLWILDRAYWHTEDMLDSERYPVSPWRHPSSVIVVDDDTAVPAIDTTDDLQNRQPTPAGDE